MAEIPWAGLAALIAMFVIPFLPAWLFEGPRTVRHRATRHVCAECGAPWASGHACAPETVPELSVVPVPEVEAPEPPLRGELRRLRPRVELRRLRPRAELARSRERISM
jgi:hypothetical protein